jgi:acetyltransferase-like isoleucine patch superfamily enzyme
VIEAGVRIIGNVQLGRDVSIAAPAELMAKDSCITIGDDTDIAAFVTISTADSHKRAQGRSGSIERRPIWIGRRCFIGVGAVILGGTVIGDESVIGAGVVLKGQVIPARSRVRPAPPIIEHGFYAEEKTDA